MDQREKLQFKEVEVNKLNEEILSLREDVEQAKEERANSYHWTTYN